MIYYFSKNMEKWANIFESIYEFIKGLIKNSKGSLEKLKLNIWTSADLSWLQKDSEGNKSKWNESDNHDNNEKPVDNLDSAKLKTFFEKSASNLSIDKIDEK